MKTKKEGTPRRSFFFVGEAGKKGGVLIFLSAVAA
jgi:hypothetical protein